MPATHQVHLFRRAAIQHCIAIATRRSKNAQVPAMTQDQLAKADPRPNAQEHWRKVLTGHAWMDLDDPVYIVQVLDPDGFPDWRHFETFLNVVQFGEKMPSDWAEIDTRF